MIPLVQIISVILDTIVITTSELCSSSLLPVNPYMYASCIGILTLALVLSCLASWASSKIGHIPRTFGHLHLLRNIMVTSIKEPESSRWQGSMFYLYFLVLPRAHRLTTRISALTITLVLAIHKAISLILSISIIGIMLVGRTILGSISLALASTKT